MGHEELDEAREMVEEKEIVRREMRRKEAVPRRGMGTVVVVAIFWSGLVYWQT